MCTEVKAWVYGKTRCPSHADAAMKIITRVHRHVGRDKKGGGGPGI